MGTYDPNKEPGVVDGGVEEKTSVSFVPGETDADPQPDTDPGQSEKPKVKDSDRKAKPESPDDKAAEDKPTEKEEAKQEDPMPKGAMKRIHKLTKQKYDAFRDREEAEKRYEAEREKAEKLEAELKKARVDRELSDHLAAMPKAENFEDNNEYLVKLSEWAAKKDRLEASATSEESAEKPKEKTKEQQEKKDEKLDAAIQKGIEKYDDFEEKLFVKDLPLTPDMVGWIKDSDVAHEIFYHLASNPEESAKISEMGSRQMERALTRIELNFTDAEEDSDPKPIEESVEAKKGEPDPAVEPKPKEPQNITKAPEPITPVRGGKTVGKKDPSKMTNEEYRRYRGYSWDARRRI